MKKMGKYVALGVAVIMVAVAACGCGAVKKEEPDVPTKYIDKADDAVEQYNEGVDQLNKTGDAAEGSEEDAQE
ncbi:MAG: hypothetical protein K6G76_11375 [Lachnospiraceae bacterium]|nr:hypothetical protein [Lachnospiraceae bacterium]